MGIARSSLSAGHFRWFFTCQELRQLLPRLLLIGGCRDPNPVQGPENRTYVPFLFFPSFCFSFASAEISAAIRPNTSLQSPGFFWRKRRMVGYHGLSSRSKSQRQQPANGRTVHTGRPSAPAKWADDVSAEMIRSRFIITAAVSEKSWSLWPNSIMPHLAPFKSASCSVP